MTANPPTCRKCGSPITSAMKFCESCGAKIEALPVCSQCGAALAPGGKFCENCGKPVVPTAAPAAAAPPPAAAVPAPVSPVPEPAPAKEVMPMAEPPMVAAPAAAPSITPAQEPAPVKEFRPPAEPPVETKSATNVEEKPMPAPGEKPAPVAVQVKEPVRTEKVREIPKDIAAKKMIPKMTMIIAGVIILALLGAAVYFFVLPMTTGPATPSQDLPVPTATTSPVSLSASPTTPAVTTQDTTISFTTGPTQVPPPNRVIVIDTERDPISSIISVTFRGGDGQYGVSQIAVTLTRSDGTVVTKTFKPETVGSGVTLQGTARTDRIEVTTYFFTGEHYRIIDRIFEYKKRGG